jgi:hypothetical protein
VLERLLIAYDWGETLVALQLVIKPLLTRCSKMAWLSWRTPMETS